ncbi:MAG: PBP1A family penicillin-binding protein [Deltaproteobacteria bacterium]|nr:PBP1A family penicillin-binding protein [Deltaproteobacteria bacterium]
MKREAGRKSKFGRVAVWLGLLLCSAVIVSALALGGIILYLSRDLPSVEQLKTYVPPEATKVFARDGRLMAEFFKERRTDIPLKSISKAMVKAILAAEDADFYKHEGLDYWGILRAALKNFRPGAAKQGASTITQQLVKLVLLSPERTYKRKLKEAILARRLEQNLTKDEILELYLNQIYLGHGRYGVAEASRFYFDVPASKLTVAQAAMLAALPKNPMGYSPLRHRDRCAARWRWVISEMVDKGLLENEKAKEIKFPEIVERTGRGRTGNEGYYSEQVRRFLVEKFGEERVLTGGLEVNTGADLDMQRQAVLALKKGLEQVDHRYGYRGPVAKFNNNVAWARRRLKKALGESPGGYGLHLVKALSKDVPTKEKGKVILDRLLDQSIPVRLKKHKVVIGLVIRVVNDKRGGKAEIDLGGGRASMLRDGLAWARKRRGARRPGKVSDVLSVGDLIQVRLKSMDKDGLFSGELFQRPRVQGSLVAIDPATRDILAMVGGYDFSESHFNRAVQAYRQPGSAIKPLVYGAALMTGRYTPATIVDDSPEVYKNLLKGSSWKPENFEKSFKGPMRLREALAHSVNMVSIKLLKDVGISRFKRFAHDMGIRSRLPSNLALALGAADLTPLEMTNAYATIAAHGKSEPAKMVKKVVDRDGKVIWRPVEMAPKHPLTRAAAFVLASMMQSVIREGTGRRALALGRPAAGKTGTSNNSRNTWFIGFTPNLVAGVWVGRDDNKPNYGEYGGSAACPIWTSFMKAALDDRTIEGFSQPPGVVVAKIDPKTGLLARENEDDAVDEVFIEGTEPKEVSTGDSMAPPDDSSMQFMMQDKQGKR